jgi:hypothetical protein
MKDSPAQFSLIGLLSLTAVVAAFFALARVLSPMHVAMVVLPLAFALAPCLIVGGAHYTLFFLRFERRMAVAETAIWLVAILSSLFGFAVGGPGVIVPLLLIVVWLPQLLLLWEWKGRKLDGIG